MKIFFSIILLVPIMGVGQPYFSKYETFPKDGQYSRGMAWGDLNGDGWSDLLVGNESPEDFQSFNLIYWNLQGEGFRMEPLDLQHLWTEGISMVDVDNDHDLDIFSSTQEDNPNQLYLNNGQGEFTKVNAGEITADTLNSPGSCWADYDRDGDLDAFVLGKELEDDHLYENKGKLEFNNLRGPWEGKGNEARACVWGDFNNDDRPDLYVNNYVIRNDGRLVSKHRNYLYLNMEDGFKEVEEGHYVTAEYAGYGVSVVDLESDGDLDIYVSNIAWSDDNNFYRNNGSAEFETVWDLEISKYLRKPTKGHTWGDFNQDGLIDLYLATGTVGSPVRFHEIQNYLMIQNPDSSFLRVYEDASVMTADVSAGTASADFDNDGDLDIAVANWGKGENDNLFYLNQTTGKWLKIRLVGKESNSYGIGSWVTITTSHKGVLRTQKRYHYPFSGYGSMNEPIVHFGLGNDDLITEIEVKWPLGKIQNFRGIRANQTLIIDEEEGIQSYSN